MKAVGQEWLTLTAKQKTQYTKMAEKDKLRYQRELE